MRKPENRFQTWPVGDARRALVPQAAGEALVEEAVAPFDLPPCGCRSDWVLIPIFFLHSINEMHGLPRIVDIRWTIHVTHRQACAKANA